MNFTYRTVGVVEGRGRGGGKNYTSKCSEMTKPRHYVTFIPHFQQFAKLTNVFKFLFSALKGQDGIEKQNGQLSRLREHLGSSYLREYDRERCCSSNNQ
jgi:site-specific recombinase